MYDGVAGTRLTALCSSKSLGKHKIFDGRARQDESTFSFRFRDNLEPMQ
jgi:hypothetical protein